MGNKMALLYFQCPQLFEYDVQAGTEPDDVPTLANWLETERHLLSGKTDSTVNYNKFKLGRVKSSRIKTTK